MSQPTFDLRHQPWLLVRLTDGTVTELSLTEVFARARSVRELAGEVPTQVFALHRLLLALLHRAVPWRAGQELEQWRAAWEGGLDLVSLVSEHLDAHADRFDLLHPVTPFFQVAGLATAKGTVSPLTSLVADVPNGHQYFTTRAGRSLERISWAEAARWLVHVQSFDPSGIKSGAVGDPRVKGGRGYPIGTAWAGSIGGLVVEGENLHQTLLLNLVLLDRDRRSWAAGDSVPWERGPQGPTVEAGHSEPLGPADLLTWQSRRVRLVGDQGGATGAVLANGDPLSPQDRFGVEAMTGWRRSQPQEKKLGRTPVYMPSQHQPERAVWRGLPAMLALGGRPSRTEAPSHLSPGVLEWVEVLTDDGLLDEDAPLRTRATSVRYGSNQSVIDEIVDDALTVHAVLLAERGDVLRAAAIQAVEVTDVAVRALAGLAADLTEAAGGSPDDAGAARDRARERAYFTLDAPFRTWLTSLRAGARGQERRETWERFTDQKLRDLADEMLSDAGVPAWVGREVRDRTGSHHVDSALAHLWFGASLRKALVLAGPPEPSLAGAPPETATLPSERTPS